jgi:hypothetical protein
MLPQFNVCLFTICHVLIYLGLPFLICPPTFSGMVSSSLKKWSPPSYVDIRSRANTTRGLDYEHMIKARAHKEGVRIGKTPKKLASICCP